MTKQFNHECYLDEILSEDDPAGLKHVAIDTVNEC